VRQIGGNEGKKLKKTSEINKVSCGAKI